VENFIQKAVANIAPDLATKIVISRSSFIESHDQGKSATHLLETIALRLQSQKKI
jgi:hypothetical protein